MDLLRGLNPEQAEGVKHFKGPCAMSAPAGSGKTNCFVRRIAHLTTLGVNPTRILGMTFTKAAATDMQRRLLDFLPKFTALQVPLSTIHSWCYQVVAEEFKDKYREQLSGRYLIVEEREQGRITREFIEANKLDKRLDETILSAIGMAKNYIVFPAQAKAFFEAPPKPLKPYENPEMLAHAYAYYQDALAKLTQKVRVKGQWIDKPGVGKLDFDDLLIMVWQLFKDKPEIAQKWAKKYDFIQVDEGQDCCVVQFSILDQLLEHGGHGNVFIVGDIRQSIYQFRGACPGEFQRFIERHNCLIISLLSNYRSRGEIVELGNRISALMEDVAENLRTPMVATRNG